MKRITVVNQKERITADIEQLSSKVAAILLPRQVTCWVT